MEFEEWQLSASNHIIFIRSQAICDSRRRLIVRDSHLWCSSGFYPTSEAETATKNAHQVQGRELNLKY